MDQNKRQAVALMRYSAIAPLIAGTQEDYESLRAYYRDVSAKGIKAPDGQNGILPTKTPDLTDCFPRVVLTAA